MLPLHLELYLILVTHPRDSMTPDTFNLIPASVLRLLRLLFGLRREICSADLLDNHHLSLVMIQILDVALLASLC